MTATPSWLRPLWNSLSNESTRRRRSRRKTAPLAAVEVLESRILLAFDPSPQEQELLERVNHMRADPGDVIGLFGRNSQDPYELLINGDLFESGPLLSLDPDIQTALDFFNVDRDVLQFGHTVGGPNNTFINTGDGFFNLFGPPFDAPLAWSESLDTAATSHSQAMIDADRQEHELPGEDTVFNRLTAAGYTDFAENIFAFGESVAHVHGAFAIDWGGSPFRGGIQFPPAHRLNIVNPDFQEIGISILEDNNPGTGVGPLVVTQDFGGNDPETTPTNPYLLGVAYVDRNIDGRYQAGEGLGGVNITVTGQPSGINQTPITVSTTSMSAGGYQIALPPGFYSVTASGGGLLQPQTRAFFLSSPSTAFPNRNKRIEFVTSNIGGVGDVTQLLVTGADAGGGPHVRVFDARTNRPRLEIMAYEADFRGGVRVAAGDVNGDGIFDVITAPGPGRAPEIKVFSGVDGRLIHSFMAYDERFTGGVFVAAADLTSENSFSFSSQSTSSQDPLGLRPDGKVEIITGPDAGHSPLVKVFDLNRNLNFNDPLNTPASSFMAYDERFTGGVRVAAADVDGLLNRTSPSVQTGGLRRPEIITAPGAGGGPHVQVFRLIPSRQVDPPTSQFFFGFGGFNGIGIGALRIRSFNAYDPRFTGGVYIAGADVNLDGKADLITGAGAGGGPHVQVFSGADNSRLASFFAFDPLFTGGVRVGTGVINTDLNPDILMAAGPGGGPHVRTISGRNLPMDVPIQNDLNSFFTYNPRFSGGVFASGALATRPPGSASGAVLIPPSSFGSGTGSQPGTGSAAADGADDLTSLVNQVELALSAVAPELLGQIDLPELVRTFTEELGPVLIDDEEDLKALIPRVARVLGEDLDAVFDDALLDALLELV